MVDLAQQPHTQCPKCRGGGLMILPRHPPARCDICGGTGRVVSTCSWSADEDGIWVASCGSFVFSGFNPREHQFKHCPYCGKSLKIIDPAPTRRGARGVPCRKA